MKQIVHQFLALFLVVVSCAGQACANDDNHNSQDALFRRIDRVIAKVRARELNSLDHTPWVIMHAVIAYEKDLNVVDATSKGKVNAIKYLCESAKYEGKRIFRAAGGKPALPTRSLSFGLRQSFKVQDHVDQFLMAFADADVSLKTPIVAEGGKKFTVGDMLTAAKTDLKDTQELGWTLVATATYLSTNEKWSAKNGKEYRIEEIVALAIEKDPRFETEGGPHHLYGVAYALNKYRKEHGNKLAGTWAKAQTYLDKYTALAKQYQLPDGSFSAVMFRGSRKASSPRQMVWATGHTIEWLSVALTREQLQQKWVRRGVEALLDMMEKQPLKAFSDGGLYHAVHGLRRYKMKVGK